MRHGIHLFSTGIGDDLVALQCDGAIVFVASRIRKPGGERAWRLMLND